MKKIRRILMLNGILLNTKGLGSVLKLKFLYYELFGLINLIRKRRSFIFFDKPFLYDNPSTLFTILLYPREVMEMIGDNINSSVETILDIGGNLGQFPLTAMNLFPNITHIDIFEPNKEIYGMLEFNSSKYEKITTFPFGIGPEGRSDLYYVPNKSAKASVISEFSVDPGDHPVKTSVDMVSDVEKVTGRKRYDLVIIDVEGFEYEVLKCLANLEVKYLYVEMSVGKRRMYKSSEIYQQIYNNWGDYNILTHSEWIKGAKYYDTLIEISS